MTMFRVLSYNVQALRQGREDVANVIRECAADVACVQESPRLLGWRSRCGALATRSGLRIIAGGRPAGLLILGGPRTRVLHTESRWLSFVPRYLQRGLALAVVHISGTAARVTVANMHLDLYAAGRLRHTHEIRARLTRASRAYGAQSVLTGDVNEQPGQPAWKAITVDGGLRDAYTAAPRGDGRTFPADHPRFRIDAIFACPELTVRGCGVPDLPGTATASDHRPVLAEFSWSDTPGATVWSS